MKNEIAIKINYNVLGKNDEENYGEDDVNQFRNRIQDHYLVTFHKHIAERGGGNFLIEFLIGLTLKDYLMVIAGGLAWDLIKIGSKKFFIQPFIDEYKKFRLTPYSQEIRDIAFTFSDTKLRILSARKDGVEVSFGIISRIFQKLAANYSKLDIDKHNKLTEITIPIFADSITADGLVYREKLEYDEPLLYEENLDIFNNEAYLKYWGLTFNNYNRKVFNVDSKSILNSSWYTGDEYNWHIERGLKF